MQSSDRICDDCGLGPKAKRFWLWERGRMLGHKPGRRVDGRFPVVFLWGSVSLSQVS